MEKKYYTRRFRSSHERTLKYLGEARIKSADNEEMQKNSSDDREYANFEFFFWCDENSICLVPEIEESYESEISSESTGTFHMSDSTIECGIIYHDDRYCPDDESNASENKLRHRNKLKNY